MQLSPSFSLLFTSLLLALSFSFSNTADAKPLHFGKIITMPVKRYVRSNVHPSIALQPPINHGLSPLADMNGSPHVSRADGYSGSVPQTRDEKGGKPTKEPKAKSLHLTNGGRDIHYLATIQIGTPPRDFSILMDSGSAGFWVGSEECVLQEGGSCGYRLTLGQQSSSSFTGSQQGFEISYGGSLSIIGTIVHDDISIAGLTLKGHTFGVANVQSQALFRDLPVDGLMSLGPSTSNRQGTPTPVEALAKAGLIDAPIVSYKLSREKDQQDDGEITFGGLDTTKFDRNTLVTFDNISPLGWVAKVEDITIGSLKLPGGSAMLDPGIALALFPLDVVKAIHGQIPGAASDGKGGFTMPCNTSTVISLTIGNGIFDINPKDLNGGSATETCASRIRTSDGIIGGNVWLLGTTFLKSVYFSTNFERNTISLAKRV